MEYNFDDDLDLALNTVLLRHSEFNHSFYRLWTWKVHLQILIAFIEPSAATQVKKRFRHLQKMPKASRVIRG